jgi:hypothetical protein
MDKDGHLTLNQGKCVMCNKAVNLWQYNTFEYGKEGEIWCDECYQRESDIGEAP